ncbi:hypothetical protein HGM15179_012115 [Zosterops borbonicus]|uniref:Uncharacterized protein n=1 Tax=Zosterops borbonicus TaxID=364589 RepID=A0A8K1GBI6_9PASS|nr:hypothetical protein HGM15179_012115 [Zosterops borbonicus]
MKPCHAAKPPCAGMPCQQSVLQLRVTVLLPHARASHQWIVLQLCKTARPSYAGTSYQQSVLQPSQAALMLGLAATKLSQVTMSATVLFCAAVSGEQSATVPSCTGPAAALVSPALSTPMQSTGLLMAELNMPLVSMDMLRPPSPRAGWLGSQITPTIQPLLGTATPHCDLWADPGHMSSWMPRCQTNIIPGGSSGTEDPQVAAL